jgi:hypothetical protein
MSPVLAIISTVDFATVNKHVGALPKNTEKAVDFMRRYFNE